MAKYKFRLETLQKVREARRDEHRTSLAEAFRAEQVLAESRAELVDGDRTSCANCNGRRWPASTRM